MRATHGAAVNERHGTEGFKQKSERSCGDIPVVCAIRASLSVSLPTGGESGAPRVHFDW